MWGRACTKNTMQNFDTTMDDKIEPSVGALRSKKQTRLRGGFPTGACEIAPHLSRVQALAPTGACASVGGRAA